MSMFANLIRIFHPVYIAVWLLALLVHLQGTWGAGYDYFGVDALWMDHVPTIAIMIVAGGLSTFAMFLHHASMSSGESSGVEGFMVLVFGYLPSILLALAGVGAIILGVFMLSVGIVVPLLMVVAGLITLPPVLIRDFWA